MKSSTNIYLKPTFSKGLKILGATKDAKNSASSTAKAQFEVYKIYASASHRFKLLKDLSLNFTSEFDGQKSQHTLFGSEQVSVGGYYTVRGFRENFIDGDSGYYLRNKINFNLGNLVSNIFGSDLSENKEEEKKLISSAKNFSQKNLSKIALEPFFDYGYSKNRYDGSDGRLSSTGIKAIFNGNYFRASATYGRILGRSRLISSPQKEREMIYFELSLNCC